MKAYFFESTKHIVLL